MPPKVPDYGHREADKKLSALIRRLHLSYRQARIGLQDKIEKYLEEFEKEDAEKRALYDSGELSHEDFLKWRRKEIIETKAWRDMLNQLADDMTHQNQIAASMIDDTLPDVYALNHNYGTFEAEKGSGHDTTYTLYDKSTVKRLLTEDEDLLPHPSVPVEKDKLWNKQHLQSAVLQGILTGESMGDIAKRFQSVTDMTERAAMRNARTAVTGAENAGRIDSYKRAVAMGIKMRQMWMSVHDGRTRDSHAIMDGEQQEVGELFSNGCRFPGDPHGAPAEVYNCRCRTKAVVEGSDAYENGYNPALRPSKYLQDRGLTYEQWKEMHRDRFYLKHFKDVQNVQTQQQTSNLFVVDTKTHRPMSIQEFIDTEDDYDKAVIFQTNAYISQSDLPERLQVGGESTTQNLVYSFGLNDKPTVLKSREFDQYLNENGIENSDIITRSVSANTVNTLTDWMNDDLNYISGRFGGANYGEGFYFGHNFGKKMNYGGEDNKTIRAVLKPDAKILKIEDLPEVYKNLPYDNIGELLNPNNDKDKSTIAILGGYDAIIAPNGYTCIINRSCVIVDENIF